MKDRNPPKVYKCFEALRPRDWTPMDHVRLYLRLRDKHPEELPDTQIVIDKMLKEVAKGSCPRSVFSDSPRPGKQGKRDTLVAQAACAEVMRLSSDRAITDRDRNMVKNKLLPEFFLTAWPKLGKDDAIDLVAKCFGRSKKQVKRDICAYSDRGFDCGSVETYVHNLGALISRTKQWTSCNKLAGVAAHEIRHFAAHEIKDEKSKGGGGVLVVTRKDK